MKQSQQLPASATATGEKVVGAVEASYDDEPPRADIPATPPRATGAGEYPTSPDAMSTGKSLAWSLRTSRIRAITPISPRSPRAKKEGIPHMWDVVKFATASYRDVHLQV